MDYDFWSPERIAEQAELTTAPGNHEFHIARYFHDQYEFSTENLQHSKLRQGRLVPALSQAILNVNQAFPAAERRGVSYCTAIQLEYERITGQKQDAP